MRRKKDWDRGKKGVWKGNQCQAKDYIDRLPLMRRSLLDFHPTVRGNLLTMPFFIILISIVDFEPLLESASCARVHTLISGPFLINFYY